MSSFMVMEPRNQSFRELIGNGARYHVPRFQRDYAWNNEQWEDLWSDIETLEDERFHYMGYIVLQPKGEEHDYEIIDGQQRLITLSLIALAAIKNIQNLVGQDIDAEANKERVRVLTERFVGAKSPITLSVDNKLSLNRNNHRNFRSICSNLDVSNRRGLTSTNKLINKAFEFFTSKNMGNTGQEIAEFIESVSDGMLFTQIVVQDELNAYKVFETLNARGVQLSTPDLLKNYIFSVVTKNNDVPDEELNDLDDRWSEIVSQLGESNFTDFIRYHYNFQSKMVTKKELFSAVRRLITVPSMAYSYLESLSQYASVYASLLNAHDDWWGNQDAVYREARKFIEGLNLFNIKQPFTILMASFYKFTPEEFVKLCRYLYVLSIRYNAICHMSPSEQESAYNQIAMKVYDKTYKRAGHVKNGEEFRKLYPDDQTFYNAFEFHKMPSRQSSKKVRFLLAEIEEHLGHSSEYSKMSLEHVCPYHPEQGWNDYFGEGVYDIQDRLGNMVLLENDDLGRATFSDKKIAYEKSPFPLANKVSTYHEWNLQQLNDYQSWLANQAVTTWAVSFQ